MCSYIAALEASRLMAVSSKVYVYLMVAKKGQPPAEPPKAAASSGTAAAHGGAWSGMLPPEAVA